MLFPISQRNELELYIKGILQDFIIQFGKESNGTIPRLDPFLVPEKTVVRHKSWDFGAFKFDLEAVMDVECKI